MICCPDATAPAANKWRLKVFLHKQRKPDFLAGQHPHYYIFQGGQDKRNKLFLSKLSQHVILSISETTDLATLAWGMFILNTSSHFWNAHSGVLVCLLTCQSLPTPSTRKKKKKSSTGVCLTCSNNVSTCALALWPSVISLRVWVRGSLPEWLLFLADPLLPKPPPRAIPPWIWPIIRLHTQRRQE